MDVSGTWTAVQGNNTTVVFNVRQSGSDIQVTGTFGGTQGSGGGFVEANVMYFQVDWPGSPNGEPYRVYRRAVSVTQATAACA